MAPDALTAAATVLAAVIALVPVFVRRRRARRLGRGPKEPTPRSASSGPVTLSASVVSRPADDYPAWLVEGLPLGDRVYLRERTLRELLATIAAVHPLKASSVGD